MFLSLLNEKIQYQYIAWGLLVALLALHWAWCQFVAYPISFEKKLKRGKSWVYIPLKWKGAYKIQIQFSFLLLMLCLVVVGLLLVSYYPHKTARPWYLSY